MEEQPLAIEQLQAEVAKLQAIGVRFLDIKQEIAGLVAAQRANREALASAKSSSGMEQWVQRPGAVWLRLPQEQAVRVLRQEGQNLAAQLEQLFVQQKAVLAELEEQGLGPEHFAL